MLDFYHSYTVLLILTKLSSSHCLPNFCQKFTRRFLVFTKSGVNLSIHALLWYANAHADPDSETPDHSACMRALRIHI